MRSLNFSVKNVVKGSVFLCLSFAALASEPSSFLKEESEDDKRLPRLILSIDGGGIRGLLPTMLLQWVEEELTTEINKILPSDAPKAEVRLGEVFDLIAGTSTGGLISMGLGVPDETGRPLYSMSAFVDLYETKGQIIFPSQSSWGWFGVKYSSAPFDEILRDYFKDLTLRDLLKPTLITAYDLHQEDLFVFNSQDANHSANKNYPLVAVARATSAAPTYLPAIDVQEAGGQTHTLIDGGVSANNPAVLAYLEAQKLWPHNRLHMISLGCGSSPVFTLESKREKGKLHWAGDITSVLMNTTSNMTHHLMDQLAKLKGDKYLRIQFTLDQKANGLDNATPENINILKGYAKREIRNPHSPIHDIKKVLFDVYQARGFYLFFPLIKSLEKQLSAQPEALDLSSFPLTERALWEATDALQKNNRYFQITRLILDKNAVSSSWIRYLAPLTNLTHLSLRQIDGKYPLEESLATLNELQRKSLTLLTSLNLGDNPTFQKLEAEKVVFFLKPYRAIELDPQVCGILGDYYRFQHDIRKAQSYYRQGIFDKRNQLALSTLLLSARGDQAQEAFGEGFMLCQALADQREAEAQYMLGHLYASFESEVRTWLLQKNLLENTDDLLSLRSQADQRAGYYYRLSADQKHKKAALALGTLYRDHRLAAPVSGIQRGEKAQLREAAKYYQIAAEAGSESAKNLLQEVLGELQM